MDHLVADLYLDQETGQWYVLQIASSAYDDSTNSSDWEVERWAGPLDGETFQRVKATASTNGLDWREDELPEGWDGWKVIDQIWAEPYGDDEY